VRLTPKRIEQIRLCRDLDAPDRERTKDIGDLLGHIKAIEEELAWERGTRSPISTYRYPCGHLWESVPVADPHDCPVCDYLAEVARLRDALGGLLVLINAYMEEQAEEPCGDVALWCSLAREALEGKA